MDLLSLKNSVYLQELESWQLDFPVLVHEGISPFIQELKQESPVTMTQAFEDYYDLDDFRIYHRIQCGHMCKKIKYIDNHLFFCTTQLSSSQYCMDGWVGACNLLYVSSHGQGIRCAFEDLYFYSPIFYFILHYHVVGLAWFKYVRVSCQE